MCGICGKINLNGQPVERRLIEQMNAALAHRGPDADGILLDQDHAGGLSVGVGLGHKRLSIIDLTQAGRQPMSNEDQSIWMVFNGEIYNHAALSPHLKEKGHRFSSNTDGEVILHLYEDQGIACLQDLNGMFSFALWDKRRHVFYLVRDRLGIKPLLYSFNGTSLTFASEMESLLQDTSIARELNTSALETYLTFNYIPAPESIFRNVCKLEPASFLKLENGKISVERYWDIPATTPVLNDNDYPLYQDRLAKLMQEAVGLQMMSDVPLGAFLSGGIDSSLVVALMAQCSNRPIQTFSIGFKDMPMFDESLYARQVSERYRTYHHEIKLASRDVLDATLEILKTVQEPFADSSAIPTFIVSRETARHVKVVLSGDGGDELFAGYRMYAGEYWSGVYRKVPSILRHMLLEPVFNALPDARDVPLLERIRRMKKFLKGARKNNLDERFMAWNEIMTPDLRRELLRQPIDAQIRPWKDALSYLNSDPLNRMLYADVRHSLPGDMLTKVDLMSMRHSLEVRVPLLDHCVVELAFAMPGHWKMHNGRGKHILRETFKHLLPESVLERPKWGFEVPIGTWLKSDLKFLIDEHLNQRRIERQNIFNYAAIQRVVNEHLAGRRDHAWVLWNLIVFQAWSGRMLR